MSRFDFPVIIAGGGPVGMTAALDLQQRGIKVLVLEQNLTTTRHPKMDITNGRSMEHFRRLGIAEFMRDFAVPRENGMDVSWVTRQNEWELARFSYPNVHDWRRDILSNNDGSQPLEPNMRMSQVVLEAELRKVLEASPLVDLRFGWKVIDFQQDNTGVDVIAQEFETGQIRKFRCQLLAGCDGGGSVVRQRLGFSLEGEFDVVQFFMIHFRSEAQQLLERFGKAWHYQSPFGSTMIAQNDKDIWTLHVLLPPEIDPGEIDPEILAFETIGEEFPIEVIQANAWAPHLVVSTGCGEGRVWLAGDALHQVIPTGGYGMNTGICDAADLAWKFAAYLDGWGGENLLPSIEAERHPIAHFIVGHSKSHMAVRLKIAQAYDPLIHEDSEIGAVARFKMGELIVSLGNAENESWGVELDSRYRGSPIIWNEPNEPSWDPLKVTPTSWPGTRAPHVFLNDGQAIFDLLGEGFTLVRFSDIDVSSLIEAARDKGVPIKMLDIRDEHARRIYERDLVLVRPDQFVAWRGDSAPENPEDVIDRIRGANVLGVISAAAGTIENVPG